MNSSSNTTFFTSNSTGRADSKRDTVTISVEEFEELISAKQVLKEHKIKLADFKEELADIKATLQSMLAEVEA